MQFFIEMIWGFLLPIPMPWQMLLVFFLVIIFAPWIILRLLPWLTVKFLQVFLFLIKLIANFWYFLDYQIAQAIRKGNGTPPEILYIVSDIIGSGVRFTQYLKTSAEHLFISTSRIPWKLRQSQIGWYALPLVILPIWFSRPHLGNSGFTALIDRSIGQWCSLEHWAMVNEWTPSSLTCRYPNSSSQWDTLLKVKEYELKRDIQKYTREIESQPKNADAYYKRGNAYLNIGNIDNAFKDYTASIKADSKYIPSYIGRGDIYLSKEDKDGAFKEYSRAVDLDSKYAPSYIGTGDVYLAMNDKVSAFAEYSKASSINSSYAPSYVGRGDVYQRSGDKDAALREYNKAIQVDPKYAVAHIKLGNLYYYDLDNREAAIKEYALALDLSIRNGLISPYIETIKRQDELNNYIVYTVKSGDSLNNIAQSYNVTMETIISINKETYILLVTDTENLEIGWKLKIPKK